MPLISALTSSTVVSECFVEELLIDLVLLDFDQIFNEFLPVLVLDVPALSE